MKVTWLSPGGTGTSSGTASQLQSVGGLTEMCAVRFLLVMLITVRERVIGLLGTADTSRSELSRALKATGAGGSDWYARHGATNKTGNHQIASNQATASIPVTERIKASQPAVGLSVQFC